MNYKPLTVILLVAAAVCGPGAAQAEGLVQTASKNAAKGAIAGVAQETNSKDLIEGTKQVTKGMLNGVSDAAPELTSQMVKQADVNKKTIGKVARTVTGQAVAGVVDATTNALGPDGDSRMTDAMVATTERMTAAVVRGIKDESNFNIHINVNPWLLVLGVVIGAFATFLCAALMLLLYIAFTRRRPAVEVAPTPMYAAHPAGGR